MTDSDVPETQLKFRWELLTLALTAQVNAGNRKVFAVYLHFPCAKITRPTTK